MDETPRCPSTRPECGSSRRCRVPRPAGTMRAAMATAVPPDEPPGISEGSYGLRTGPACAARFVLVMPNASSCMLALPSTIAPASINRCTEGAFVAGTKPSSAGVPAEVCKPAVLMLSLTTMASRRAAIALSAQADNASMRLRRGKRAVEIECGERVQVRERCGSREQGGDVVGGVEAPGLDRADRLRGGQRELFIDGPCHDWLSPCRCRWRSA